MKNNIVELDSLRGLAALVVLFSHFSILSPLLFDPISPSNNNWVLMLLRYSPTRIFFLGGFGAVVLFFVLSGFVLSLRFWERRQESYPIFVFRRVLRIYVPYLGAIALAIYLNGTVQHEPIASLSSWYNDGSKYTELTKDILFGHIFLIGIFDTTAYDNVIWSLVHEMRISLGFPILMFVLIRSTVKKGLLFACLTAALGWGLYPWINNYADTLLFAPLFILGAILAKNGKACASYVASMGKKEKLVLFIFAILACFYVKAPASISFGLRGISYFINAAGACAIIVFAFSSATASSILHMAPVRFMGKISYSLYLCHCIILFAAVKTYYGKFSMPLILLMAFAASIIVASISFVVLEKPSIWLGRILIRRNSGKVSSIQRTRSEAV